jgi:hypothetical protein
MHVAGAEGVFVAHEHEAPGDLARAPLEVLERAAPEVEHFGCQAAGGRGLRAEQRVANERNIAVCERETCFIEAPARVARSFHARVPRVDRREPALAERKGLPFRGAARLPPAAIADRGEIAPQRGIGIEFAQHLAVGFLGHIIYAASAARWRGWQRERVNLP